MKQKTNYLWQFKQWILSVVRRSYWIIYQNSNGQKYYYIKDSTWTTDIKRAAKYKKHPTLFWMGIDHLTMRVLY